MFYRYHNFVKMYACWILYFLIAQPAISQSKAYTWFEAQTVCREKNQSLTLWKNESTSFYWTGFYKKRSQWIKIIGCFATSEIQNRNNKTFQLSISSPPLCQDRCLQENIHLFAIQAKRCICLSDGFVNFQHQLESSNCTYRCNEGRLLSTECGGESAFNVFRTDTTDLSVKSRCLSLECGAYPIFTNNFCGDSLLTICSKSGDDDSIYESWEKKKKYCKGFGGYPIGNLTLSSATIACKESMHNDGSPIWVGIVRDYYQKEEQGQLISRSGQILIEKCMKCRSSYSIQGSECQYEPCDDTLDTVVYCSKKDSTTPLPVNTDTSYSETKTRISSSSVFETTSIVSIYLEITKSKVSETTSIVSIDLENIGSKEESSVIIVPVIIVPLLLFVFAVAIILYIRRKKQIKEKDINGGKKTPANESTNYSNVENHIESNYFVLQKSNPSYELAGECIVGSESPYNETEDGTYDHLGNKDARKTPDEDIYNHTLCAELSDLSDYDVANHKRINEEDSTYDHAGVKDNSYGHFDLHQIKESDYSVLS